jgi:hypothetical protein
VLHCLEVLVIPELLINLQNLVSRSVRVQQWLEVTSSATNSPWRRASDLPWYTQEPLYMQWNQQNCMTLSLILYDANRRGNNNQLTWALFKYPGKRTFIRASIFQACLDLYVPWLILFHHGSYMSNLSSILLSGALSAVLPALSLLMHFSDGFHSSC